jgi:hypothetical protein
MATNAFAAYGIYPHRVALNDILTSLNDGGVDNESICMMFSPAHPIATVVRDANAMNAERDRGAGTAGLIGWLAKFGAVVIPSVGFFIRSREFFRAIISEKESSSRCSNSGTLMGLGFSKLDADHVDHRLRDVGALVYVSCPESDKTKWALELLRDSGAEESGMVESPKAWAAQA